MSQLYSIEEVESWDASFADDVYRQAISIIAHISKNIEVIREELRGDVVKSLTELSEAVDKAVVSAPTHSNNGKVNWAAVTPGDSIWVVARHGPLAGGHILINKREDGLAVLKDQAERTKSSFVKVDREKKKQIDKVHIDRQMGKDSPAKKRPVVRRKSS